MHMEPDNDRALLWIGFTFSEPFLIIDWTLYGQKSVFMLRIYIKYYVAYFLTGRPQSVRVGHNTSSTTTLSTGAPQGCVLSPLLFTLLTHDCTAKFSSNHIKFADDTTVVGLISNNYETHYREEVAQLAEWCGANNLSLNVEKTKEVVLDFRRRNSIDHPPLTIDSSTVERVSSTKFLGVHITEDLTWTTNSLPPPILPTFYRGTIESVLTSCITVWYGNCSAADCKTLQRTVNTAAKIIGAPSHPSWTFSLQNQQHRERPHPPLPQSLPAPTIRKTVPEHQSPLRQTAQQLFPPGCESPEPKSPRPPLKPHAHPYLLNHGPSPPSLSKHPPNLTTPKQKTVKLFFVQFKVCYTQVSGPVQTTCSNTLSSIRTRHFSHTAVCTIPQKTPQYMYVYLLMHYKSSCTVPQPAAWLTMFLSAHVQYLCEAII